MTLIVMGVSHHKSPVSLLERVTLPVSGRADLVKQVLDGEHVDEIVVLSTCNRTELYASALTFHGAIAELTTALATATGVAGEKLHDELYVHYADRAVAHTFAVASGLDSMAVGEAQVLGQLREALAEGQMLASVGPKLNSLIQQALRVGKRVHAETGIDEVSLSMVEAGLLRAEAIVGVTPRVAVVGAGGMAALAAHTAYRRAARELTVLNRTLSRAETLAARVEARALPIAEVGRAIAEADVVITCTGASGVVIDPELVAGARGESPTTPMVFIDLALPHDVDAAVADLPGVTRLGIDDLREDLSAGEQLPQVRAASDLVAGEVAAFVARIGEDAVAPTVTALRARAADVVEAELRRFDRRVDLDDGAHDEVQRLVRRIVDKLLHAPTVRVKQLSAGQDGAMYAAALRELFELDPRETAAVAKPPPELGGQP